MHYSIVILDNFYHMYLDMVHMLMHSFDLNNTSYSIDYYNPNMVYTEDKRYIFFGTAYYNFSIPKGSILTEFDCVDVLKNRNISILLENNHSMFSYSRNVINYLHNLIPNLTLGMFYYGYSKYLDYGYNNEEQDIDICFVGSIDGRKKTIMDSIQSKFPDKKIFIGGYAPYLTGELRAQYYKRSKIVLSIYSYDNLFDYSSGSRIFPAVSTGAFVISEICTDPEQHSILEKVCINTEPDKLLDTIEYYLSNNEERENKRKEFYDNIKNIQASLEEVKFN